MKFLSFAIIGLVVAAASARALPVQPEPVEQSSPGLQLARRVASMENNKDLPSRAVWLGKKAALAAQNAEARKGKQPKND